jgi:hypothetical protein
MKKLFFKEILIPVFFVFFILNSNFNIFAIEPIGNLTFQDIKNAENKIDNNEYINSKLKINLKVNAKDIFVPKIIKNSLKGMYDVPFDYFLYSDILTSTEPTDYYFLL